MQELKIRAHVVQYQRDAHDLGKWPQGGPQRRILDDSGAQAYHEDGRPKIERLPSTPSCLMLHPGGSVVWVPLACGSGRHQENDPYTMKVGKEKLKKGFMPVENCPKAFDLPFSAGFPEELAAQPTCREGHKGGRITETNPCRCIVAERQLRVGLSKKRVEALNARHRGPQELDRAARNSEAEALKSAVTSAAEVKELKAALAEQAAQIKALLDASKGKRK